MSAQTLVDRLDLADALLAGRDSMLEPQDLPGRYGRVVQSLDRVLMACGCESVVGGGWAVWRHGYVGRVTQDIDVVIPDDKLAEFMQVASVSGFDVINVPEGNWPKLTHRDTGIDVDILPEGGRPGTAARPAPTTISHPRTMGSEPGRLKYIGLPALVELKLAAGRLRDEADVVELIKENSDQLDSLRVHLAAVHPQYSARLEDLIARSRE